MIPYYLINFRKCNKCSNSYANYNWCQLCHSKYFQNNFDKWTSKNNEIDKFLQEIQLNADSSYQIMEWIPYNRLFVKNHIGKGGFGTVNLASWLDGPIISWNDNNQKWNRKACHPVALKVLNDLNKSFNLLKEVSCYC